jgi:hypothetical protein
MIGGDLSVFTPHKKASETFQRRLASLLRFDGIRVMELLENIQYGVLYFILGFAFGTTLDSLFPEFNEKAEIGNVVLEVFAQTVIIIIAAFYIKKFAKVVPFLFVLKGSSDAYRPYSTSEYNGNITASLALISSQLNYIKKIDLIARDLYSRAMSLEKRKASVI